MAYSTFESTHNDTWFIDSGCTNHMCGIKYFFKELDESLKSYARLGNDESIKVEGRGTISFKTSSGNTKLLRDVQYVPRLANNLLSVSQLMLNGYSITFDNDSCSIYDKESGKKCFDVLMTSNRMFPLNTSHSCALLATEIFKENLWHLRYGHLNIRELQLLGNKEMVVGLPKISNISFYEGCMYGKQSRQTFPLGRTWRASQCLELIHADLCGPMSVETLGRSRYFLLLVDDYSRICWVYFLKYKSEAFDCFKKFKSPVEKGGECVIKTLRTDKGEEFVSGEFNTYCEDNGIFRDLTAPHTPQQNGITERKNRTIIEMARSIMNARGVPKKFWGEVVATAVYILNISPTKAVYNRTPYQAWKGRKPENAMVEELQAIVPNQTWESVDLPEGKNPIGLKWVY